MSDNKPAQRCNAPFSAFKEHRVYDSGLGDDAPCATYDYSTYRQCGIIHYADDAQHALRIARAKYGQSTNVFQVARGWVAYKV